MEYDGSDGEVVDLSLENMREMEMVIENQRPSYPTNKLTFTIDDEIKNKVIKYFSIALNLNDKYDVDLVLEDSKRNFMNSFEVILSLYKLKQIRVHTEMS